MGIIDACLNGRGGYAGKAYFFKGKIQFRDFIVLKQEQTSIVSITKRRSLFSRFWEITQVVKLARNDTRLTKPNR
jgi:hypothetical protein